MHKAVLVDDEYFDLEGLKQLIPWQEMSIEVVCTARSSFAALDFIENHPIDLLITDIKMPIMSGLELAQKVLEKKPRIKVVFISGYEDFQYARQAIALNASGYVLKPVDDAELIELLKTVVLQMDLGSKRQTSQANLAILQMLEGTHDQDKIADLPEEFGFDFSSGAYAAAMIEVDDAAGKLPAMGREQRGIELQQVVLAVTEWIRDRGIGYSCKLSDNQIGSIVMLPYEEAEARLEELVRFVEEHTDRTITAGLGGAVAAPEQVWKSFQQAKELLGYKMFIGKNKCITSKMSRVQYAKDAKDLNQILGSMFKAMVNYELVRIDDCVEDLFVLIKCLGHKITVYNFSVHVISMLDAQLNTMNESLQSILGWEFEALDVVHQFETIDDLQSWLRRCLFEISETLYMKRQNKNGKLIQDIERYVDLHLSDTLTLREVANYFSYSPNHLGYLFKEQAGEHFSDFVIRKRLEKARELLQQPALKIYQVADQVGYKNLTYFSRQFKEYYGTPPGNYRRQS